MSKPCSRNHSSCNTSLLYTEFVLIAEGHCQPRVFTVPHFHNASKLRINSLPADIFLMAEILLATVYRQCGLPLDTLINYFQFSSTSIVRSRFDQQQSTQNVPGTIQDCLWNLTLPGSLNAISAFRLFNMLSFSFTRFFTQSVFIILLNLYVTDLVQCILNKS